MAFFPKVFLCHTEQILHFYLIFKRLDTRCMAVYDQYVRFMQAYFDVVIQTAVLKTNYFP